MSYGDFWGDYSYQWVSPVSNAAYCKGVEWYFAWRDRDIPLCITCMVPSSTQYISEYLVRISALYIERNWNYHRKTLLCHSIMRQLLEKLAWAHSPGIVHIWRTVHNCTIQLIIVYEHYVIPKFVKIISLHARYNDA